MKIIGEYLIKKIIFLFLFVKMFADVIVSPDSLPQNIKEFLSKHFKAEIGLVQRDNLTYEIYLTDGTELEIYFDGTWKEIESKYTPLSFDILPPNITAIIQNEYPGVFYRELERKINYFKIKLSNNIKLEIDTNGTILKRKYDD